jgi:hypothetical protein
MDQPITNGANALQPQSTAPIATAISTINLPLLSEPQDVLLAAKENTVAGERFPFEKIKMPSGGGLSFQLTDENGKPVPVVELKGIVLGFKPFRSWYEKSFSDRNPDDDLFPDCYSADCITGSGCEAAGIPAGQKCETCPKGQWGSSRNGGRGKDCGDRMGIWILMEGYAVPHFAGLPKGSLANFKDYRRRLTQKAKVYYGVVTVVGLEAAKNDNKVEYSKATFAKAADLTAQERTLIKQYIDAISGSFQVSRDAITPDDSVHEDTGGTDINKMDFDKSEQAY